MVEMENKGKIVNYDLSFITQDITDVSEKEKMKLVVIILNRPVEYENIKHILKNTDMIICADGGANQYYNVLTKQKDEIKLGNVNEKE